MCATGHKLCYVMRCDMAQLAYRTGALIVEVRKGKGGGGDGDCGRRGGYGQVKFFFFSEMGFGEREKAGRWWW